MLVKLMEELRGTYCRKPQAARARTGCALS